MTLPKKGSRRFAWTVRFIDGICATMISILDGDTSLSTTRWFWVRYSFLIHSVGGSKSGPKLSVPLFSSRFSRVGLQKHGVSPCISVLMRMVSRSFPKANNTFSNSYARTESLPQVQDRSKFEIQQSLFAAALKLPIEPQTNA